MGRPATEVFATKLGERLYKIRTAAEIPARALGEAAGVSHAVVRHIETGHIVEPKGSIVANLAKLLGTTSDWLISGIGKAPTVLAAKAAWEKRRRAA